MNKSKFTDAKAHGKVHSGAHGHAKPKPKTLGTTWWGQRWIEAIERSSRDVVARLGKGRAYARDGHVHGLKIVPGKVTATVTDDELDSYAVSLNLDVFEAAVWNQILQAMSQQALFAAQLLNGEMPKDADRLFRSCGKSLFPANSHDIDADCGCDDWSSPCKHVAATHYVLGEALDRDPFLLFELRGRTKEQVLAGLNQLRAHTGNQEVGAAPAALELLPTAHVVALSSLPAQNFESGATALPAMSFNFDSAPVPGALLRSLGRPSSWQVNEPPQDLFGPALQHARRLAVELATGNGTLSSARSALPSGKSAATFKAAPTRKSRTKRKDL
jgi:uncharacterized Zn finger protein